MRAARVWFLPILVTIALASAAGGPAGATLPGRNGTIAFDTVVNFDLGRHRADIFTVEPDGSGLRRLTRSPRNSGSASPDWSPDGTKILFIADASGNNEIWVMNADGSGKRRVLRDPEFDDLDPSWSPDASHIVFSRCSFFDRCKLMIMRADGTGARKLLGGNWQYFAPDYSPDGTQIAFDGTRGGLQSAIWVIGTDGSGLQRLTRPRLMAFWASWSPDGQRILFSDRCCRAHSNVWTMNADGTDKQQLTDVPAGHNAAFATYAPNGRKIVLTASQAHSDGNDVFVMRADGSGLHPITSTQPGALLTDWGPRP